MLSGMLLAAALLLLPAVAGAAPPSFTWSGATPLTGPGVGNWSNTTNWEGLSVPSGSAGTLTFPALTSAACTTSFPPGTCYQSNNDLTGLTVNALSIDDGANGTPKPPQPSSYYISGNAITLGAGGITAGTTSSTPGGSALLRLPITLGASQTWSIDGNNHESQLELTGNVSGPTADTLGITLNHQASLSLNGNGVEVGPVTITGGNTNDSGSSAFLNGSVSILAPSALNASDGNAIALTDAGISAVGGSVIGPLTSTGGNLNVGTLGNGGFSGWLGVSGALTLDSASAVTLYINASGTTAGIDYSGIGYSQLRATGAVNLGGATLQLTGGNSFGGVVQCPSLNPGDVDTLVTTTGTLTGTFNGVPDGTTVPLNCSSGTKPVVRINYTANTVTATVPGSPPTNGGGSTGTTGGSTGAGGSTGGGASTGTGGGSTGAGGLPPSNAFKLGGLQPGSNGSLLVTVDVPGPGTLTAQQASGGRQASIAAKRHKRKGHAQPKLIQPVSVTATKAGAVTLTLKPTAAALKLLRGRRSVKVSVRITFTPTGGTPSSQTIQVTFKAPKRKHGH